jgi:hypothetical protein
MKVRLVVSLVGLLVVALSATQLFASPAVTEALICCSTNEECPLGLQCCAPILVGLDDCSTNMPGWCFLQCKVMSPPSEASEPR